MSEDYIRRKIHNFMRNKLGATDEFLKEVMKDYELTEDEQQKMLEFVFSDDYNNGPRIDGNAGHIYKEMFNKMYKTYTNNNIRNENLFTEFMNEFYNTNVALLYSALESVIMDVRSYDNFNSKVADIYMYVKRKLQL